jgi:hypothetical protein
MMTLLAQYYQNMLTSVLADNWVRLGDIKMEPADSMVEQ